MNTSSTKRTDLQFDVVILGAGYAGLMAALRVGRRRLGLRVALVNVEGAFVERVRLQESMVAEVVPRIPDLGRYLRSTNVEFFQGRVASIDPVERTVSVAMPHDAALPLRFDQLIYALGSRVDALKVDGARAHAFRLDTGHGGLTARGLRDKLHELARGVDRPRILVLGSGALAVEAAGEVKWTWPRMEVTVVGADQIGGFSSAEVERVLRRDLSRLGVQLVDHDPVVRVEAGQARMKSGRTIPFDACILAAGMRSPALAREAGLEVDAQDRIVVDSHLRSVSHPHVLATGDAAMPAGPTGAPYRLSALTAAVTGVYAADEVACKRRGGVQRPFTYSTFAQAVAVGRFGALFPLDPDDRQTGFVLGGRAGRVIRNFLVWLVLHFITFERLFPGVQTWPGHARDRSESGKGKAVAPRARASGDGP